NAFLLFYQFSFFSYLIILYWIPNVMSQYGGMSNTISYLGLIILAAFFSIFTGVVGSLAKRILRHGSYGIFVIPFIWIAKDLLVEKIISGFPWCLLGYSQYNNPYFLQLAEIGGVHLISFLLVFLNLLVYLLIKGKIDLANYPRPSILSDRHSLLQSLGPRLLNFILGQPLELKKDCANGIPVSVPAVFARKKICLVLMVSLFFIYTSGYFLYKRSREAVTDLPVVKAGILQPNTGNNDDFSWDKKQELLEEFFLDSRRLVARGAQFVVWPEFTVPLYPLQNKSHYRRFMWFVDNHAPLFAGFTDFQGNNRIYNSLILFHNEDAKIRKYDKVHLTPFGEYILFRDLMFFIKRITDEIGDFTPGESLHNLQLDGHLLATPICYELIFSELVREMIHRGGEVIVITSNDSWYGVTSAPHQLLAMSVLRSVENRRYILRSTTSGISALIAPWGETLYRLPLNTKGTFIAKFRYLKEQTVFTRFGYLFP
ncbi:MAG: apolipoprotein N-acyltransferase, partial [bacterium]|nr:apolipoprotein N-acyltransferase [bacterium]